MDMATPSKSDGTGQDVPAVPKDNSNTKRANSSGSAEAIFETVEVDLDARLGVVNMTIRELLALEKGAVVALDRTIADPIELRLRDKVVAHGEIVTVDDNFAIRITELLAIE